MLALPIGFRNGYESRPIGFPNHSTNRTRRRPKAVPEYCWLSRLVSRSAPNQAKSGILNLFLRILPFFPFFFPVYCNEERAKCAEKGLDYQILPSFWGYPGNRRKLAAIADASRRSRAMSWPQRPRDTKFLNPCQDSVTIPRQKFACMPFFLHLRQERTTLPAWNSEDREELKGTN